MITFGFRNRWGGILRSVVAIVLGVVMIALPSDSLEILVKVLAAMLIASGLVSAIFGIRSRQSGVLGLMLFNSIVDVLIGVLMFCYPSFVAGFLVIVLGALLLGMGLLQFLSLISASSFVKMGFAAYILPVICVCGGLLIIIQPDVIAAVLTVFAGIVLLIYGLSELIAGWKMHKAIEVYEIKFGDGEQAGGGTGSAGDNFSDAVDVEFEKVEDKDKDDTAGDSRQDN